MVIVKVRLVALPTSTLLPPKAILMDGGANTVSEPLPDELPPLLEEAKSVSV